MRVSAQRVVAESHLCQHLGDAATPGAGVAFDAEREERLTHDPVNPHPRIQRGVGILEHRLDATSETPHLCRVPRTQRLTFEEDLSRAGLAQSQQQREGRALPRA